MLDPHASMWSHPCAQENEARSHTGLLVSQALEISQRMMQKKVSAVVCVFTQPEGTLLISCLDN